jgi:hypothetical protein
MAVIITTEGEMKRPWGDETPTLDELQEAVGGYIEYVPCTGPLGFMYCNEEGKLKGLPANIHATNLIEFDDIIVGDVVLMEHGDEEE